MGLFSRKPSREEIAQQEFAASQRRREEREQRDAAEALVWVESIERNRNGDLTFSKELLARAGKLFDTPHTGTWQDFASAADKLVLKKTQRAIWEKQVGRDDPKKVAAAGADFVFWRTVGNHVTEQGVIGPGRS